MMKTLIASACVPVLLMACAPAATAVQNASTTVVQSNAMPPHFPKNLSPAGVAAADDHLALEQVQGTEAMAFVAEANRKSLGALTTDARYEPFREQAQAILTATDRIPGVSFLGDGLGNFWQDGTNPKGVWRRTSLDSYPKAAIA